jgi:hypothetical protein
MAFESYQHGDIRDRFLFILLEFCYFLKLIKLYEVNTY